MFMGQYDYAVDAKGRLNFPAKFRDGMGETFIVTRWLDHCLAAFPPEEFEKVAQVGVFPQFCGQLNAALLIRCYFHRRGIQHTADIAALYHTFFDNVHGSV